MKSHFQKITSSSILKVNAVAAFVVACLVLALVFALSAK